MVLATVTGGAPPGAPRHRSLAAEHGSQAVEFALVMPGVAVVLVVLLQAGLLGVELVAVQGVAREAARVAAVADDQTVRAAAARVAPRRQVQVELSPPAGQRRPGDLVTATVRVRSHVLRRAGVGVWLPARATMRVEDG